MRKGIRVCVVIPALNEEAAIARVIAEIPGWVDQVVVGDNGSRDNTAAVARAAGALVVSQPRRGYGSACLKAIEHLDNPGVLVFLDGDHSDYPAEMSRLVDPILEKRADMVIGSRVRGGLEPGALSIPQRLGNRLACVLIRIFWRVGYTDLGPFRAIAWPAYESLGMSDPDYGWTVEMQVKAAILGLRPLEAPVSYRRRIGRSKVSGTLKGTILAGYKILFTIFKAALWPRAYSNPESGG
jgi:glycosyltransferase involved in cell wall biosynthesis